MALVVDVADDGADLVDGALGVDDDLEAVALLLLVEVADLVVEHQLVLQAAAAAADDLEPQGEALAALALHQEARLLGSVLGECDDGHMQVLDGRF